jgi:tetratricopeptide (TPR) repeat protein
MMKKILILGIAVIAPLYIFAIEIRVGLKAPSLFLREELSGRPVSFEPEELKEGEKRPKGYKFLVGLMFFGTWAPMSDAMMPVLAELQSELRKKGFRVIAVSPESKSRVQAFLKRHPETNFAVGIDKDEKSLKGYLGVNTVLPRAVLIDEDEKVIWIGDVVDMPMLVRKYYSGNFDVENLNVVSQLLGQMRSSLRAGKNESAIKIAYRVLQKDPGNAAAIRLVLFIRESGGQLGKALDFLDKSYQKAPDSVDAAFAYLQFIQRHPEFTKKLVPVAKKALQAFKQRPRDLNSLAWMLLEMFPFENGTLEIAAKAIKLARKGLPGNSSPTLQASFLVTQARVYYKTGHLDKAIATQQKAVELLGTSIRSIAAGKLLEYYRQAKKLAVE